MSGCWFSDGSDLCGLCFCGSVSYIQLQVQLVVAQVYMVQLWFRNGVTSMWFRCVSVFSSSLSVVELVFSNGFSNGSVVPQVCVV